MTKEHITTKVLIIGSGPAGYTAAIYAARANLSPVLVMGMEVGGQLTITTDVENYPGFAAPVQGPWLMEQMRAQAEHVGTKLISDLIVKVDFSARPFTATGDSGTTYTADTVVICTGAKARWLGLPSEVTYRGYGVSACATCDGFFFRGKDVAVIGGGNSAVEEALFLSQFASKVTVIHRRDTFRAEKIGQDRLFANPKINVIWDSGVEEIMGNLPGSTTGPIGVTGLKLKNLKSGALSDLAVDGVFVAIGHDPATELFKGQIKMDESGYILTEPDSTATSVAGVFAAGDVKDKVYRQAVTAAGMGCMAALEADRFLAHHD
ncbi:MAG: thioredoxin-disulfide reductase [Alphaproteobacteria bacterium]|jgi:thioredoxin reductase (NADPH)|nr:thioredoxin-disulfide reductase [Alphaproteobacteria bacterium]MBP9868244.1 thioredoxin-disulfide reductase [Alphaproteobacteria bacterium]